MSSLLPDIDACESLSLIEISEPESNSVGFLIAEGRATGPEVSTGVGNPPIRARMVDDQNYRVFKVVWPSYVAYSVRNESYFVGDEYETFRGRRFVQYSRSRYLDFVLSGTIVQKLEPDAFRHWGIYCTDHVVDVVSLDEPVIEPVYRTRRRNGSKRRG